MMGIEMGENVRVGFDPNEAMEAKTMLVVAKECGVMADV